MGARNRRLVLCWFNLKVNTIDHYYFVVVSSYQLLLRIITKWNSNWLTKSNWHGTKMKFENGGLLNDMTTKLIGLTHVIITWITVSADCFKTVLSIYYPPPTSQLLEQMENSTFYTSCCVKTCIHPCNILMLY